MSKREVFMRRVRIMSLILATVLLMSLGLTGCKGEKSVNMELSFEPLTASAPKNIFMNNPDRGFRTDLVVYVDQLVEHANDKSRLEIEFKSIFKIYFDNLGEPCYLAFAYIDLAKWNKEALPEDALTVIDALFDYCRSRRVKLMCNFYYNGWTAVNFEASQENKDKLAAVCADQETILTHIDQLAPVIAENKDCVYDLTCGFVGYVGEWAYNYQYPIVDYNVITKAIVDKLCAPNELYFSHRLPSYRDDAAAAYPDWENIKWISTSNCAMYGETYEKDWHSACFQVNHTEEGTGGICPITLHVNNTMWEDVAETGAYTPQGGEMYTMQALNRYNMIPNGKDMILEVAHHWHSNMSFWHGRYDSRSKELINPMKEWETQPVTAEWLDEQSIVYDPNWFLDDSGNTVERNCYEFIRDHLGYKLVAENASVKTENGKIKIDMSLKNYGMSAAFYLESGFAILDENYEVVSEVKAGEPDKWYSHDPENYKSNTVLEHNISAELPAPEEGQKYCLAFYLRNTQGTGARLSNNIVFTEEYNILCMF